MYLRKKNTWYTLRDGNWSDPNTWSSNGRHAHNFPQAGDNVVISHNVILDNPVYINYAYSINDLTVTGKLTVKGAGTTVSIRGNLYADTGTIDLSGSSASFNLWGPVTNFGTLIPGTASYVGYWGNCTQYISKPVNGDYNFLYITNGAYVNGSPITTKYLMYDIKDVAMVTVYLTSLEIGDHNVEFNACSFGNSSGTVTAALSRKGTGTTVIKGLCSGISYIDVGNNPLEFRGGITAGVAAVINASEIRFTTNNQTFKGILSTTATTPIIIGSGVTLTLDGTNTNTWLTLLSTINGTDSTSILNCNPTSYLILKGAPTDPMVTGVWQAAGSVYYSFGSGSFTIKKPTYVELNIYDSAQCTYTAGTDITAASVNFWKSNLELSSYNLVVNGAAALSGFQLSRNGSGNTVIKGLLTYSAAAAILLGNNTLELQNGLTTPGVQDTYTWNLGNLLISTRDQTWNMTSVWTNLTVINGNVRVASGVKLTNLANLTLNGALVAEDATATLENQKLIEYDYAQEPMSGGGLICNTVANTFIYGKSGAQDIKAGNYRTLTLKGSGIKKLLGNVNVQTSYTLSSPATLDNNGFTLTHP
ncbi:hypothetical protein [Mucilaginibacter oryzae]|nr:hypothetical protein [Mucilaginibacter oryzae]